MNKFDVIILGAGGIGSAAGYYLSKEKKRVLILEQFEINHQKGSSYGDSRVIRYAYDNPIYTQLMRAAYPLWFTLEKEARETLFIPTGELDFGDFNNNQTLQQLVVSMETSQLPYERLTAKEIKARFPQFNIPENMTGLYQKDTGILKASKCVLSHLNLAQKYGAIIEDKTPVIKIINTGKTITVKTAKENYICEKLIMATGSWTKQLLIQLNLSLPLTIMPCQIGIFQSNSSQEFTPGKFPIFLAHMTEDCGQFPYGIPLYNHNGIKFSTFYGWDTVEDVKQINYNPDPEWIEKSRRFISQYLPLANGKLLETRRCLYTMTPDKHFIVDYHPEFDNILIATGFSGHGFKFTTLIGKILTDLIIHQTTEHDLSLFKIFRFCA